VFRCYLGDREDGNPIFQIFLVPAVTTPNVLPRSAYDTEGRIPELRSHWRLFHSLSQSRFIPAFSERTRVLVIAGVDGLVAWSTTPVIFFVSLSKLEAIPTPGIFQS